jgi:hypothetical protein
MADGGSPIWVPMEWDALQKAQGNGRAQKFNNFVNSTKALFDSPDPKVKVAVARAQAGFARLKDIAVGTVHQNSTLSTMSVQYANEMYIGDQLMPVVPVAKKSDVYYIYDKRARLAYPDDALGERAQANEISDSRSTASYLCKVYGYENFLDAETLENQDAPLNEMMDLIEAILEGLAFRRELRIATVLTTSANFGSNTAAATTKWDTASGGTIIADIQNAVKALWQGRGQSEIVGFTSYDVYCVMSRNPAILDLFKYNGSSPGLATPEMIAKFLGMDRLLVGKSRKDTANEGQTASYGRMWSNVFGVVRVAKRPSIRTASFGYTLRHGAQMSTQWFDQRPGKAGGYWGKCSVSEDHKIVANDTGYLLTAVIA